MAVAGSGGWLPKLKHVAGIHSMLGSLKMNNQSGAQDALILECANRRGFTTYQRVHIETGMPFGDIGRAFGRLEEAGLLYRDGDCMRVSI